MTGKMRVLVLPVNTASEISHKVTALRRLGIDASGLTIGGNRFQATKGIKVFPAVTNNSLTTRLKWKLFFGQIWRLIYQADIIHWLSDAWPLTLPGNESFMKWVDKPGVVQWGGSEIRIPEIESDTNPYYREAFSEAYEYPDESRER